MKPKAIFIAILLSFIIIFSSYAKKSEFPVLKGPYLGQKPPGSIPKLFAGRISSNVVIENIPVFGENGNLLIFARSSSSVNGIFLMEQKDGIWLK